jgi:hypothetical protein
MRVLYPKQPEEIQLRETRYELDGGIPRKEGSSKEITLKDKLDDYFLRIGYTNVHVLSIIVQLFTQGKVRIEFATYNERLELVDMGNVLSRAQAVTLLDDYIVKLRGPESPPHAGVTRRITVQLPKQRGQQS